MDELDARLHRIGQHHFRAKFRLRGRDRVVVGLRGITTVRRRAAELVERRLAPAEPHNDGRQTPYRGHPVFVARHATAACCRTCLAHWHGIPAGRQHQPGGHLSRGTLRLNRLPLASGAGLRSPGRSRR
ncbi:DUF4186 family protein [Actinomadura kijaniata]|uniref:DUF4186 family protein n=1 Tax=Actinomadura kijaniata TaxID=46161 RepID=UPI003F1D2EDA